MEARILANIPHDSRPLGLLIYSDRRDDIREALIDWINAKHEDRSVTYTHTQAKIALASHRQSSPRIGNWIG